MICSCGGMCRSHEVKAAYVYTCNGCGRRHEIKKENPVGDNIINGRFPDKQHGKGRVVEGSFYEITVTYALTDELTGEWQYRATVKEFPDVTCWAYHAGQAYWMAVDAVEGLIGMALDMGREYPACQWAMDDGVRND